MTRRKKDRQKTLAEREHLGKKGQWVINAGGLKGQLICDVKSRREVVSVMHVDGIPRAYSQRELRACRRPHEHPVPSEAVYAIT